MFFSTHIWIFGEVSGTTQLSMAKVRLGTHIFCALFLVSLATLFSCRQPGTPEIPVRTQGGVIIPVPGEGIALFAPGDDGVEELPVETRQEIRVDVPTDFIPHDVLELSLDVDDPDEQIIVFKTRDGQDDRISLLLGDYDPLRDGYFISWQGQTNATSLKTFTLTTQDITGDRRLEIVAFGTNNLGEQTLDIFSQVSSNTYGIQFRNIISIEADVEIDIRVVERGEFYNSGARNGVPFTITATDQDLESENNFDMIRSVYSWRPSEQRYLLSNTESIPGSRIEQDQLAEVFSGNLQDLQRFLEGPWVRRGDTKMVAFSQIEESIKFIIDDRLIDFQWLRSQPWASTGTRGMTINLRNGNISSVAPLMTIRIEDLNSIYIRLNNEPTEPRLWFLTGYYDRMTGASPTALNFSAVLPANHRELHPFGISGLYRSDNNWEMFFSAPQLTLRSQERERTGGYAIFRINDQHILSINYIGTGGTAPEKQQFLISYEELEEGDSLRRIILLQEAALSSYGARAITDEVIRLEQRIELDDSE